MRRTLEHTSNVDDNVIYLGMDVHKHHINVTVIAKRCVQSRAHVRTQEICRYVEGLQAKYDTGHIVAAYEAGFCGFSLQRRLAAAGVDTLVVNAADIPTTDKQRTTKHDRGDSARIGKALSDGALHGVWIPDKELEGDRELVRHRRRLLLTLLRVRNTIKGHLHKHGVAIPPDLDTPTWSRAFRQWLREVQMPSASSQMTFALLLDDHDHWVEQINKHMVRLVALAATERYAANMELLTSIPGIGRLTAICLLTMIGPIERFPTAERFASYIGLVPMQHQSGGTDRTMPIQRRAQTDLRRMLVQCAWISKNREPAMRAHFDKCRTRMPGNKAIIAVARRLTNVVYAVLKHQRPYESPRHA